MIYFIFSIKLRYNKRNGVANVFNIFEIEIKFEWDYVGMYYHGTNFVVYLILVCKLKTNILLILR